MLKYRLVGARWLLLTGIASQMVCSSPTLAVPKSPGHSKPKNKAPVRPWVDYEGMRYYVGTNEYSLFGTKGPLTEAFWTKVPPNNGALTGLRLVVHNISAKPRNASVLLECRTDDPNLKLHVMESMRWGETKDPEIVPYPAGGVRVNIRELLPNEQDSVVLQVSQGRIVAVQNDDATREMGLGFFVMPSAKIGRTYTISFGIRSPNTPWSYQFATKKRVRVVEKSDADLQFRLQP